MKVNRLKIIKFVLIFCVVFLKKILNIIIFKILLFWEKRNCGKIFY